jgi:3-oxoadipate enol-lactonase
MSGRVESGYAPVAGGRLYYERKGEGPDLVLLHSGFLDRRMWDPQFELYANQYSVLRYDLRGHGLSPKGEAPYVDAEDLRTLLDHLGIDRTFLVGNSNGARVASGFAAGAPERVRGLVLVGGGPGDLDPTPEEEQRFLDSLPDREEKILALAAEGRSADAVGTMLEIWAPAVDDATRTHLRAMATENLAAFVALGRGTLPTKSPSYPVADRLRSGTVPLLIVVGDRDHPALQMMLGRYAQQVPNANFVLLKGADHTANLSDRKEFNRVVLNFLSVLATPASASTA